MKKSASTLLIATLLTATAFVFSPSESAAQGITRVGIKGGLNASSLYYDSQGVNNKRNALASTRASFLS